MERIDLFKQHLSEKRAVKVISGIDNFDIELAKKVISAAEQAKASAIDVAFSEEIIYLAKEISSLPVFVSSVVPSELKRAVELGADAIELGNFDALYKKGESFSAQDVLDLTKETLSLLNGTDTFFSVTVPGNLEIAEQIDLARKLEELGIDLIQTEGAFVSEVKSEGAKGLVEKATTSIANTIELARNVEIPVMTASGITPTTAGFAYSAGASAIGVGSCVNKLSSTIAMIATISSLVEIANRNKIETQELLNV